MWQERCKIVAAEKEASYEERQRKQLWTFCRYLQHNPDLIPQHQRRLIQKNETYFQRQTFNNVLMWKRKLDIILDPNIVDPNEKLTSHFKTTQQSNTTKTKRKTSKPKKQQKQFQQKTNIPQ